MTVQTINRAENSNALVITKVAFTTTCYDGCFNISKVYVNDKAEQFVNDFKNYPKLLLCSSKVLFIFVA